MSIEWDNSITEVSDTDKSNCEYCEINITNTFEKFAKSIGGDHLWHKIIDEIAMDHGYIKPNYYDVAKEPMPEEFCNKPSIEQDKKIKVKYEQSSPEEHWRIVPDKI